MTNPHPKLTEAQLVGRDFLVETERAILADGTGFGKTAQALAAINQLNLTKVLWVTGGQAAYQVESETPRFAPSHTARVVRGDKSFRIRVYANRPNITTISYETLRGDIDTLTKLKWDGLVLDDASKFKNPQSALSLAAAKISPKIPHAWALTATPIENNLVDLWSIFHCIGLHPLGLDSNLPRYVEWSIESRGTYSIKSVKRYNNLQEIPDLIRPYILRRANTEGPEIVLLTQHVGLYPQQLTVYNAARKGLFGMGVHDKFTRALMACDSTEFHAPPGVSAKIDMLVDLVKSRDSKFVIYSRWKAALRHLKRLLQENQIQYVEISGDVPIEIRAVNQRNFNLNPIVKCCLITTAGEQGLNLPAAQYLLCLNRIANPARMQQVWGRIRRHDSTFDKVFVIDFVVKNSVEERLTELLSQRQKLSDQLLGDDPLARLSTEDIAGILIADAKNVPLVVERPSQNPSAHPTTFTKTHIPQQIERKNYLEGDE